MNVCQNVVVEMKDPQLSKEPKKVLAKSKETVAIEVKACCVSNSNSAEQARVNSP
jgi:hypothetical protein